MGTHQDTDPQAQHYRYRQLEFPDSLRMMELLPGHDGDDLRICVFQVRRSKAPVYKALSYTWGDAALVCDVHEILSGNTVSITKELEAALRALRHETDTGTFWIDAICIDQTNVDERGHQVSMMGGIFQSAEIVVIWLGECTGEAKEEVDAINALADIQRERADSDAGLCEYDNTLLPLGAMLTDLLGGSAIYTFLFRPWFERVWTVQEFVLAREIEMHIANLSFPLASFYDAMNLLWLPFQPHAPADLTRIIFPDRLPSGLQHCQHKVNMIWELVQLRREHNVSKTHLLRCVMNVSRHRQCADPRDRVFAMLGLAADCTIVPDYKATYAQVCLEFATQCLLDGEVSLMNECGRAESYEHQNLEPSFVPDISSSATPYSILALAQGSAMAYAGFWRRQKARKVDATSISLPGVAVDEIATTTHFSGYLDSANDGWRNYDDPPLSAFELTWAPVITYLSNHAKMLNPAILDELQKPRERRLQQLESRAAKIEGREAEIDPGLMDISQESYMSRILADQGDDELFETGFWGRELNDESARWIASIFDAHSIFETKLGYLGIGPRALRLGDQVVILDRGDTPFVLREAAHISTSKQKRWKLVGDAYLLGWMDGDYHGCKVADEDVDDQNAAKRREAGAEQDSKDPGDPLRPRALVGTSFILC